MPKALSLRDGVQKLSNSQTIFLNDFWDAKFLMPLDTILQASNRLYRVHYSLSVIDRTLRCAALRTHSFAWTVDLPLDPAHGQREREREIACALSMVPAGRVTRALYLSAAGVTGVKTAIHTVRSRGRRVTAGYSLASP